MGSNRGAPALQVRLLGPVDAAVDGVARVVSGARRKTVLAVLALHAGQTIGVERLIDGVWGASPPATAANTVQAHVSYLRRILGDREAIVTSARGYSLNPDIATTDVAVAQGLIRASHRTGDAAGRVTRLRTALDLWRGEPLVDLNGALWLEGQAARLEQLRLAALEALIATRMTLGEHLQVLPELQQLAERHPFHEHFHQQLMLALYRSGRQSESLAAYQRLRRSINRELGIDPGPELRGLYTAILRQDASLDAPEPSVRSAPGARCGPRCARGLSLNTRWAPVRAHPARSHA